MKKALLLVLFFLQILRGATTAQNIYASIGKEAEVLTLSNGKYQEFFPNDTIVRIGTVLLNTKTQEIVDFVTASDTAQFVEADVASRFLSVDPIGREYPELTPYQFAGNTPIQAIDLDGLEPFYIMGTNQEQTYDREGYGKEEASGNPTTFTKPMLENMNYVVNNIVTSDHKQPLNTQFTWERLNGTFNDVNDRQKAAQSLADYVITNHVDGEPITLIGYSHGGNVALQAAPIIFEKLKQKVNIISINTPTSNEGPTKIIGAKESREIPSPRWSENPDNSKIKEAVNSHYHFYTKEVDWTVKGSWFLEGSSNSYESKIPFKIQTPSNENCGNHGNIYCPDTIKPAFEESKLPRQSKSN